MAVNPEELLYAETHEWVRVDEAGGVKVGTVGITAFAVEQLTDLVYLELPSVGTQVSAGEEFGEVESVKAVSSLYSPVTGEITEVNTGLPDNLDDLSSSPFNDGWILKVKITDESSFASLLDHTAYKKQCDAEA